MSNKLEIFETDKKGNVIDKDRKIKYLEDRIADLYDRIRELRRRKYYNKTHVK